MTAEEFKQQRIKFDEGKNLIVPDNSILSMNKFVEMYGPQDIHLATTLSLEVFQDWLLRIKLRQAEGYYIKFNGETIKVDKNGTLEKYPEDLFPLSLLILVNLI